MTARVWRKGPPPSVGWWPATRHRSRMILRWWNGSAWSPPVTSVFTAKEAAVEAAKVDAHWQDAIEWTDRPADWPARSLT